MNDETYHQAVLVDEVIDNLNISPDGNYCDGTLGAAGHSMCILEKSRPNGFLVGLDQDPDALHFSRKKLAPYRDRVAIHRENFANITTVLRQHDHPPMNGVLVDLGVSSHQLTSAARGFSIVNDGPLDMRMNQTGRTAQELIAELSQQDLSQVIYDYGEERASRAIARKLKKKQQEGKLTTTRQLADAVVEVTGKRPQQKVHPATRTFMALRIAVNDELNVLRRFLDGVPQCLVTGGRLAVIAFHSLEDRIVKRCFSDWCQACSCPPGLPQCVCNKKQTFRPITSGAIKPSEQEVARNPRARSARLRVVERL